MAKATDYYRLTKPGIIRGNLLTAAAGFFLAARCDIQIDLLVATLIGLGMIIACGCVVNNYTDKKIDSLMDRTRSRALVIGKINDRQAFIFAVLLGLVGSLILGLLTNTLTVILGLFGLFAYLVLYGIAKRKTIHGTLVGSLAGAIPPVVGYCAVSNKIDLAAVLLFLILIAWQMPHFYSIAIYRLSDYKAAHLPVLPNVKGIEVTKKQILFYVQIYLIFNLALSVLGYTGYVYFAVNAVAGMGWVYLALRGYKVTNDLKWAKQMFKFSLATLSLFCLTIFLNSWLP